jgi:hypothetical protein
MGLQRTIEGDVATRKPTRPILISAPDTGGPGATAVQPQSLRGGIPPSPPSGRPRSHPMAVDAHFRDLIRSQAVMRLQCLALLATSRCTNGDNMLQHGRRSVAVSNASLAGTLVTGRSRQSQTARAPSPGRLCCPREIPVLLPGPLPSFAMLVTGLGGQDIVASRPPLAALPATRRAACQRTATSAAI